MRSSVATVKHYLGAIRDADWPGLAATLRPDVVRIGPFHDVYEGRDAYVAFLGALVPTLEGYELTVTRIDPTPGGAVVELSETMMVDGVRTRTDEALVFDVDEHGLIHRIAIYIQTPGRVGPGNGSILDGHAERTPSANNPAS